MRISDWSSDVCSSDLLDNPGSAFGAEEMAGEHLNTGPIMTGRSPRHLTKPSCLLNIGEAGILTPPTQFAPIPGYRLVYPIGFLRRWYVREWASDIGSAGTSLSLQRRQQGALLPPVSSCLFPQCP